MRFRKSGARRQSIIFREKDIQADPGAATTTAHPSSTKRRMIVPPAVSAWTGTPAT